MITYVKDSTFEAEVLNSSVPVIVDFYADWCGPCRMLGPILEELAEENPDIKVCKVNVDENNGLATKFGIMSIPTIISFKDGKQYKTTKGVQPKPAILALVK